MKQTMLAQIPGGTTEVVVSPVLGGLGVHRSINVTQTNVRTGAKQPARLYRISHLSTGRSIPRHFERKKDAVAAMRRILPLADWESDKPELPLDVIRLIMAVVGDYEAIVVEVVDE